jgi:hypothetical protein
LILTLERAILPFSRFIEKKENLTGTFVMEIGQTISHKQLGYGLHFYVALF